MVDAVNAAFIGNARAVFAALYGEKRGAAVCDAVIPGILRDFRRMLQAAAPGETVRETYRLDDRRGELRAEGRRDGDGLFLTALSLDGTAVDLGGPALRL